MNGDPRMDSLNELMEIETWSRERIEGHQLARLGIVTSYAWRSSAFYRKLWRKAGITPEDIRSRDDFERLPLVTKRDLLRAGEQWISSGNGYVGFSTRGTSGDPLLLWLHPEEHQAYILPTMRGYRWAGFREGMTALLMSPAWHRLAACEGHAIARLGGSPAYFWGSISGSQSVEGFLRALNEIRPEFIATTAPFLLSALRECERSGLDPATAFASVRSQVLVGLPLTPGFRTFLIQRLGGTEIFERSGTQEGAALDECRYHTAPHVHADVCILEVVDRHGKRVADGTRGSLLVTKLVAQGSPFIRYNTEDIAAFLPEPCPCGYQLPCLKIYGRPESSVIVGRQLITAFDVRSRVDEDPQLAGRNLLLVRDTEGISNALTVAIEGEATNADALKARLEKALNIQAVILLWLGNIRLQWGFRQVVERREIPLSA